MARIENYDREARIRSIDDAARDVAQLLHATVKLEADMGGVWALYLNLGSRHGEDGPPDTFGIDPDSFPLEWVLDVAGGEHIVESGLGLSSTPATVAAWVRDQVIALGS